MTSSCCSSSLREICPRKKECMMSLISSSFKLTLQSLPASFLHLKGWTSATVPSLFTDAHSHLWKWVKLNKYLKIHYSTNTIQILSCFNAEHFIWYSFLCRLSITLVGLNQNEWLMYGVSVFCRRTPQVWIPRFVSRTAQTERQWTVFSWATKSVRKQLMGLYKSPQRPLDQVFIKLC